MSAHDLCSVFSFNSNRNEPTIVTAVFKIDFVCRFYWLEIIEFIRQTYENNPGKILKKKKIKL